MNRERKKKSECARKQWCALQFQQAFEVETKKGKIVIDVRRHWNKKFTICIHEHIN